MLFKDNGCLAQQGAMAFEALEKLPAYHLAYGSDPATATVLVRQMLTDCDAPKLAVEQNTVMAKI
jgi:hypothetical protein